MNAAAQKMGARRTPLHAENKLYNAARPTLTVLVEAGGDRYFWQAFLDVQVCKLRGKLLKPRKESPP